MKLTELKQLVKKAQKEKYAIPSFCVWDSGTVNSAIKAAYEMKAPVILMNGPGEIGLLPPSSIYTSAIETLKRYPARIAMHLDHGDSLDQVREFISAKYNSVMLDFSKKPFKENVEAMKIVAKLAKPKNICVEGELGTVGKVDDATLEGANTNTLTDPDEAVKYVKQTGVDLLAISIGNSHGMYTVLPKLDFKRIETIRDKTGLPLVLHGGSGTAPEDIREAISLGMCKVNVASELIKSVREALLDFWKDKKHGWLPKEQTSAMSAYELIAKKWIKLCGAENKAL
jgi:tagatose 1,6-diphosphate aldolase GatY/KbaY